MNGSAVYTMPGTSNVSWYWAKSGDAEIHGCAVPSAFVPGAVSTSVHVSGTTTVSSPVSSTSST